MSFRLCTYTIVAEAFGKGARKRKSTWHSYTWKDCPSGFFFYANLRKILI